MSWSDECLSLTDPVISMWLLCYRECQKQHWKDGHKLMCGKKDTFDQIKVPNDPAVTGIPNAIPPFAHSSALLSQIKMLTICQPRQDYFVSR